MTDLIEFLKPLSITLEIINIILLAILFYIYFRSYKEVKSSFVKGLLIFVIIFLTQSLVSLYFSVNFVSRIPPDGITVPDINIFRIPALFNLIISLLKTLAFAILVKMSWE